MTIDLLAPKFLVLYVFLLSSLFVHFRGRARLPILRQIGNHSTLMAPYNVLMYTFSAVPARPYQDLRDFPELGRLREHWETIRAEAQSLLDGGGLTAARNHADIGFNSFFQRGWKRFYLKWYDDPPPSALALCPRTVALLASIPSINAALFTFLPPRSRLNEHRDPSAASLRYQLGLVTPNSDQCFIDVDGERYSWRDGGDVLFDETYLHFVENNTDQTRLVLLCDVERPLHGAPVRALNRLFERVVLRAAATRNDESEHVGWINRVYQPLGFIKGWMTRAKRANRTLFNGCKYALIGGVLVWIYAF